MVRYETAAAALNFTTYLLACNPDVQVDAIWCLRILPASARAEMVTKATRKTFNILTTFDQDLWGKTNSRRLPSSCWLEAGGAVQQECKTDPSQALSNDILVDVTSKSKWAGEPDWTDNESERQGDTWVAADIAFCEGYSLVALKISVKGICEPDRNSLKSLSFRVYSTIFHFLCWSICPTHVWGNICEWKTNKTAKHRAATVSFVLSSFESSRKCPGNL